MSQAANYVNYCLDKAKKELQEGKKHKGLVEIKSDLKRASYRLQSHGIKNNKS